jgi:N4-gp56 family major capsid protein
VVVTGTSALSAQIKPVYDAEFYMQSQAMLYWDQFSDLRKQMDGQGGSSYEYPILANLPPATAVLNELTDVTPIPLSSAALQVLLTEHGSAVQVAEFAVATSYADVYKQAAYANGYQLAESFDFIVRATAGQGSLFFRQGNVGARTAFDGTGNAAHRATPEWLQFLVTMARYMRVPAYEDGTYCTNVHPFVHLDLLHSNSVQSMAVRQTPEMLFNGEMMEWGGLRILTSANAKGFYGAGAARATTPVATTLNGAVVAGATTIIVAAATNIAIGDFLAINDAEETGNTWSDTNELVLVTGVAGTTITVMAMDPGPGTGGGLRYGHASGTVVKDNNSVYPIPIIGPNSLSKVASTFTGPYGRTTVTGPFDYLGRFLAFGWYSITGWNRTMEGWIPRGECGSSTS